MPSQKEIASPNSSWIPKEGIEAFERIIQDQPQTLIICHANPDGDALGALLGLGALLLDRHVPTTMACIDGVPPAFQFLHGADAVVTDFEPDAFSHIIFVDCGAHYMTRYHDIYPQILTDQFTTINIDHHPSNDRWATVNIVVEHAASTTQILSHLAQQLRWSLSPTIATALLTGLYTDTGAFMHQNTTPDVYKDAGTLVSQGGNVHDIARSVFHRFEFKTLKLWGKVLQELHLTEDRAAIVGIHEKDYTELGCTRADLAGVIDYVSSMPEADYCVVLSEDGKGNVKASLRTRKEYIDVKALAQKYGGGGHVKASGFTVPQGKLKKEVVWKIVPEDSTQTQN